LRRVGTDTNWVSISVAASRNVAIKSDGTIWTWGRCATPQLTRPTALLTPVQAAPGNDWKETAAGGIHILAIKKDGTLWGWGNNWAGSVGIASITGSYTPVQIGAATNWTKVWASILESVGLQADGSLWYWGDNLNPTLAQSDRIPTPTRVNADTDWADVGFGVHTVFGIKTDGTLWVWGRNAHFYTGITNPVQNTIPTRLGTDSDWRSISASAGWWCQGLTKRDGSLWLLDASDMDANGPRRPNPQIRFRRARFQQPYVAYAGGAAHAAPPGVHGTLGVVLTADGEVWTWGMVLGEPLSLKGEAQALLASLIRVFNRKIPEPAPPAVFHARPWQLPNE
jgi:alpha-tubulin suppressor-like RCC1 family protein